MREQAGGVLREVPPAYGPRPAIWNGERRRKPSNRNPPEQPPAAPRPNTAKKEQTK